jgi:hypothetical protein
MPQFHTECDEYGTPVPASQALSFTSEHLPLAVWLRQQKVDGINCSFPHMRYGLTLEGQSLLVRFDFSETWLRPAFDLPYFALASDREAR